MNRDEALRRRIRNRPTDQTKGMAHALVKAMHNKKKMPVGHKAESKPSEYKKLSIEEYEKKYQNE